MQTKFGRKKTTYKGSIPTAKLAAISEVKLDVFFEMKR
ncbi:hypothetical protein DI53_2161 [Sphingobacterium deserti]|uniref:Uncharacterized protein n=1 Tax=Sphingobacterium deserti TaxID=1229276 RepID=A0A0B8T0D0_9SPHI|nr:hypothetical protein DI53_2161 [Sphingobacterium deserti]